jgi:hypothetical protein
VSQPGAHQLGLIQQVETPKGDLGSGQTCLRQFDFAV